MIVISLGVEGQINGTAENITQAGEVVLYSMGSEGAGEVIAHFTGDREFARFGNALLVSTVSSLS